MKFIEAGRLVMAKAFQWHKKNGQMPNTRPPRINSA